MRSSKVRRWLRWKVRHPFRPVPPPVSLAQANAVLKEAYVGPIREQLMRDSFLLEAASWWTPEVPDPVAEELDEQIDELESVFLVHVEDLECWPVAIFDFKDEAVEFARSLDHVGVVVSRFVMNGRPVDVFDHQHVQVWSPFLDRKPA